jgi:hypothetical protein
MINAMKPIPKIFATLHDGYKVKANWMTDHINLPKWH